jgi:hypothetical protein
LARFIRQKHLREFAPINSLIGLPCASKPVGLEQLPQVRRAPDMVSKKRQTGASFPEAAAIHRAQASICLDLAAKSREFWVTACLIDLAQELLNRANRDR